ncbi:MAG: hypothetical protein NC314_04305 [Roseburia sp.]|nr:hypothetical protein [Roseburia sp.]MCM1242041.1 hypothetical protein [Roseburia sp.]
MKKRYKKIVVCVIIIAILLCGIFVNYMKKQEKNRILGIKNVIVQNGEYVVLDQSGTVWKWKEGETKENAVAIPEMEDIVQLVDTGYNSIYALTDEGDVYAWGINIGYLIDPAEHTGVEFPEPIKLEGLSNIVSIDAANGQAFALNNNGQLFVWGLGRYKASEEDYIPSLLEGYRELTDNVAEIYPGTGNFHYFKTKDNQFFSIMSAEHIGDSLAYFIVPSFPGEPSASNWLDDIHTGKNEQIFDIREEGGFCFVYLYEMGQNDNIALLAADGYTMYMYQKDGTLWYWNSERITYHDCERAGASLELQALDYSGFFEEVDIGNVLSTEIDRRVIPAVISISPGKDGALFLMEDGRVFASEYITTEVRDVEHFDSRNPNPHISVRTAVEPHLSLKGLSFHQLEFENIVNISSDKNNNFYLIDKSANIYCYQIET